MKKIFDIIIGFILATCFIIIGFPSSSFTLDNFRYWVGAAFGLGLAYCIDAWNKEKIDNLEKEIEDLKNNK